ncbi:MAG: hypothetical protein K9I68_08510 [Bacteroidales bacterium]|nr:hypothetical protein [Bacteroidales bacterium]MCF8337639.1 hypothetical protein [Bacteroidales bacterium]
MHNTRPYIYQIFTRLFGNKQEEMTFNGSRDENGTGKFDKAMVEVIREILHLNEFRTAFGIRKIVQEEY